VTEYLKDGPFTVPAPGTDAYRDGWERTFGKPLIGPGCPGCGADTAFLLCVECSTRALHDGTGFSRVSWDEPADDMASLDGAPDLEHPPACEEQDSCQPGHAKDT